MPSSVSAREYDQDFQVKGPQASTRIRPANVVLERRLHYVGEIWMSLANNGMFGSDHSAGYSCAQDEAFLRIGWCPSFEFPGGSRIDYLWAGGFWFGCTKGPDTLVSCGYSQSGGNFELNAFVPVATEIPPDFSSGCGTFGENKQLEQVYYCVYSDTAHLASTGPGHVPIGLEITQVSHQSSDNVARDFVIFDMYIKNISEEPLYGLYMGVFADCDAYYEYEGGTPYVDDISGFLATYPSPVDPQFDDTLNIAWTADNDGDPESGRFPRLSARGAMGWRFLRIPEGADITYNWWAFQSGQDWGPRLASDLRDLGTGGEGSPFGDLNKYHIMSNGEQDYGQIEAGMPIHEQNGWKPNWGIQTCNLADGADTRSVLAAGPHEVLYPGETVPFTVAFLAGKDLHRYPDAFDKWECADPQPYIADLNFAHLAKTAWWAGFVFDNYGVDTDNDGYGGEFYPPEGLDTVYYTGDGCPDFSGPAPPAGPTSADLSISSQPARLVVTWTGASSELSVDPLLRVNDFEGYRIYIAERNSPNDIPSSGEYSLLASWDVIDYRLVTYEPRAGVWEVTSHPKTTEEWREIFKDNTCPDAPEIETFDPRDYPTPSLQNAYCYTELDRFGQEVIRQAYFEPQDFNLGDTIIMGGEVIPNLIQHIADVDTVIGEDTFQYGIYRVVLDDLLPAKHYFVSVTAFDFGDPANNLDPLETTPGVSKVGGIPIYSADVVEDLWSRGGDYRDSVRVSVYPNPYKISFKDPKGELTSYREQGYEGRYGQAVETIGDQDRRIHFINVPDTATIRIYSLDGDLIRELNHPDRILSTYSSKISWDLVSRNTQAVESGIYIYRIDSRLGSQIGKLVIIK
jgi:hypothetical protein